MAVIELGDYGPDFKADPYPYYAKLREAGPAHEVRTPDGRQFWLVVGYDEGRAALNDPRLSKSPRTVNAQVPNEAIMGPHVLSLDPPDHTRLRKLIAGEFTARRVANLRPRIQQITDELIDTMLPAGRADLLDALAFPLPIIVICELLGVPQADREVFREWTNEIVAPTTPTAARDYTIELGGYLDELIKDKSAAEPADDLLSALLRARDESGDRLSADELRAMAYILLIAGHETTVNLISNGIRTLLGHPEQLAALRGDFTQVDGAIEEMLRFEGPVETSTPRFTKEPYPVGDVVIPARRMVLVALAGADRDPQRFADPDVFDIHRTAKGGGQGHLAFGYGIHFCIGAPLARLEGQIAVRTLLERCPDLALDPVAGSGYDWLPGMLIRGVRELPVTW
ncbi:cytochrome P450 [Streptomyces sp. 150FB]|uniref:cytochrome P450 family protein n=1 Tax=Streptomyces sp. 150FB TaxID=1576605 RepID=UPI0005896BD1|nr:cytochrome P450 [Streptomyces sp. 150FB]KIF77540.1 cytochrome P450 [Streptomyces sp. 150FB]